MDDLTFFREDLDEETTYRTPRPSREASTEALARLALEAALTVSQRRRLKRDPSLVLVVEVPDADWVVPIKEACERMRAWDAVVARTGSSRLEDVPSRGNDVIARALGRGGAVLGVSHDPARYLPSVLVAVDIRVRIGPPREDLVAKAIRAVTGRAPSKLPKDAAAGLSYWELAACIRSTPKASRDRLAAAVRAKSIVDPAVASAPSFRSMVGYGAAHDWGSRLLEDLDAWRRGELPFDLIDRCAVLASDPGLGKSTFARALAKEAKLQLVISSVSSWFTSSNGYLDGVLKQIDNVFDQAIYSAPSLLFLDEIDSVPSRDALDERSRSWWTPVCTHILLRVDRLVTDPDARVCLIGATNHAARLDPALIRPGRLGRIITIQRPSAEQLAGIARQHLGEDLADVDLRIVGELGQGATGAQVAGWVREARSLARAAGRPMTLADLTGLLAPPDPRPDDLLWRSALHEAAHAVVTEAVGTGRVLQVDVIARGGSGGGAAVRSLLPATPMRDDLERLILSLLAGRAAEVAFLGEACAGAGGGSDTDLGRATAVLASIHGSLGLGIGLAYLGPPEDVAGLMRHDPALRVAVEGDLRRLHTAAEHLVTRHRRAIERVAEHLMKNRVAAGDEVRAMLLIDERESVR